jgi:hypothetical protein
MTGKDQDYFHVDVKSLPRLLESCLVSRDIFPVFCVPHRTDRESYEG